MAALLAALGAGWGVRADGGVNVWTSHGPGAGTVSLLVAAPGNPTRLLAGTASGAPPSGGLWASTDAAATWHNCAAPADLGNVNALAFDPSNPAVAYAATSRAGVMRSQDGGEHWTSVSALIAWAIAIAPSKPTTIYAVETYGAILKSEDGAVTWRSVSSGLPTGTRVESIAVQPDSELTVYAGTVGGGVFKSTDGGATWAVASAGLPNTSFRVFRLTFDLHTPPGLLVVIGDYYRDQSALFRSGLYRSTDGGTRWDTVFSYSASTTLWDVELGPGNPQLIYLIPASAGQTLFKSSDDGATWFTLTIPSGTGQLAVDPTNAEVVYAGTSGGAGVLKSADGGMTWAPSGRGLASTNAGPLALDPGPGSTLYAICDSTELFSSQDHGGSWIRLGEIPRCNFPSAIVVDPSNPDTLYAGCHLDGAFKSYDGGRSWAGINHGFGFGGVYALAIDPSNPLTLYAGSQRFSYSFSGRSGDEGTSFGSGNPVYKTTNGGVTWEVMSSGLSNTSITVNALALDPRDTATVFAAGRGLWRSTNGGGDWALFSSLTLFPSIAAIGVVPRDSDTVFCTVDSRPNTVGGFVYKITDRGSTWTTSSPPGGARTLVLDPVNPATLYVGGYGGVSMSLDGGTTWTLINSGLTNVHVTALVIDRTGTMLHAATDGGGVFDLEISTATPEISVSPEAPTMPVGTNTVLTATINPPQLTDTQLAVRSSDSAVASVPDAVTLPAGETSISFTVTGVGAGGPAEITVRLPDALGGASGTVAVTVTASTGHVPRKHLVRPRP